MTANYGHTILSKSMALFLATNPKFGATLSCLEHTKKACSYFISDDDAYRFSLSFFLPITPPFSTAERHRFRYNNRLSVMMVATSKKFPFGPLSSLLGAIVLLGEAASESCLAYIVPTNEEETRRQAENLISSIPAFRADFCGDRIQNRGPQNWPGRRRKIGRINVWWMLRWTIKEPSTTTSSRKKQKAVEKLWRDRSELEQQEKRDAFSVFTSCGDAPRLLSVLSLLIFGGQLEAAFFPHALVIGGYEWFSLERLTAG